MHNIEGEPLIGPRSDERGERREEGVSLDGHPLWMAFLEDPDAPTVSSSEVHDAKNEFDKMKQEHPEFIEQLQNQKLDQAQSSIRDLRSRNFSQAA